MKIAIIMLTFNRLDFTKKAIEDILNDSSVTKPDLYIIDQGSTDGTVEYLRDLTVEVKQLARLTLLPSNIGIARAMCLGYLDILNSSEGYDLTIKVDNDIRLITPNIFDRVTEFYRSVATEHGHDNFNRVIMAPQNVDIDPTYLPYHEKGMLIDRFSHTAHVSGLFMVMTREATRDYVASAFIEGAPIEKDYRRGQYWRSKFYHVGYVNDLLVGHVGEGKSTPDEKYIF